MLRNHFNKLLIVLLALGIVACNKGKADVTLEGFVYDDTFQTLMVDQKVELYEVEAGTNAEKLIASAHTNQIGRYSFTFQRDKAEKYIVRVTPQDYFPINEIVNFDDLSIEEKNFRDVSTTAKSWVRLVFTNVAPANSWDDLRYTLDEGKTDCEGCMSSEPQHLIGEIDTVIYTLNDGNAPFRYYYVLESTPLSGYKSATTAAFDTTTIQLEY